MRLWGAVAARLRGPQWRAHATAVLHPGARVVNNLRAPDAICVGANTHIKGELLTFAHGGSIRVGDYCFLGEHSRIWSARSVEIGDRVLISHNVNIFDNATHPINARARHEQFKSIIAGSHPLGIDLQERPVRIESDVLIGCMCVVLSGVTIGRGAIVGAGSVVTANVPPYAIVAGNPARLVREVPMHER